MKKLLFLITLISSQLVVGQDRKLHVTTESEAARIAFQAGRNAAFFYDQKQALKYLDAALDKDSTFVLALIHRAGMSNRNSPERTFYFAKANKFKNEASEHERMLLQAFEAFLTTEHQDILHAIKILKKLHELYPDDHFLPTYIGLRYLFNLKDYNMAEEFFERAIDINPKFAQGYLWLALSHQFRKDYANAEIKLKTSCLLAPNELKPLSYLGDLYLEQNKNDMAIESFEQALIRDPNDPYVKDNLKNLLEEHPGKRKGSNYQEYNIRRLSYEDREFIVT